ncbi:MAG: hypothetical protein KGZ89_07020 [Actinobacteria bacterium]|nr:hypothetical protein [Actinomycetota bacterium]
MRRLRLTRKLAIIGGLTFFAALLAFAFAYVYLGIFMNEDPTVGPDVLMVAEGVELSIPEGYEAWTVDEPYRRFDVYRSNEALDLVLRALVLPSQVASRALPALRSEVAVKPAPAMLPDSWEWGIFQAPQDDLEVNALARVIKEVEGGAVVVTVYRPALESDEDSAEEAIVRFLRE